MEEEEEEGEGGRRIMMMIQSKQKNSVLNYKWEIQDYLLVTVDQM